MADVQFEPNVKKEKYPLTASELEVGHFYLSESGKIVIAARDYDGTTPRRVEVFALDTGFGGFGPLARFKLLVDGVIIITV